MEGLSQPQERFHNINSFFSDHETESDSEPASDAGAESGAESGADSGADSGAESGTDSDTETLSEWLTKQRELEADYNEFYPEIPTSIQLYFLYITNNNELEGLGKETHILDQYGKVNKHSLFSIIEARQNNSNKNYKLCNILKYNITATPREILEKELDDVSCNLYFDEVNGSVPIIFNETICVLQDLNTLFVVLKEIEQPNKTSPSHKTHPKLTRRIKFKKKSHSTRRKRA